MKKEYKLSIECYDELEEPGDDCIWLDTGETTIQLPKEIAKYLEDTGILGMA